MSERIEQLLDNLAKAKADLVDARLHLMQAQRMAERIEHRRAEWASELLGDMVETSEKVLREMLRDYRMMAVNGCPPQCIPPDCPIALAMGTPTVA